MTAGDCDAVKDHADPGPSNVSTSARVPGVLGVAALSAVSIVVLRAREYWNSPLRIHDLWREKGDRGRGGDACMRKGEQKTGDMTGRHNALKFFFLLLSRCRESKAVPWSR